ncbi:type 1 glutamine amidotransferase domain-containing protein [Robertkochia marina]|uniref:Type 1 glutamine amidotransferase domain-containing protein n=2 Tax=Robertkochia marina TaxID=1227945 RepID=A0A4V3UYG2_9FLAO|nr:type 1 glutamine amidotransferase domain-containing protein [Robertkochia marina]TRZ40834.1 type 1 glutamine amidotransferase domain-containing protein [Robertkochia marina]
MYLKQYYIMKKAMICLVLILPFMLLAQAKNDPKKILMVVSSYGKDLGETRPGYEFDEFTQAYLIFKKNGLVVDVASPKGGSVEADQFNKDKIYNQAVLNDQEVMKVLRSTLATSEVDPSGYDAVYVVGGKGAMFDLPYDPSLQDILLNLYRREGTVISAVCHGPAAFVNVKDGDKFIIEGIEMTGFCNLEEDLFGKKWVKEFPFRLEDQLKARGAVFSQADFMLSGVAVSRKFITGQNPFSTTGSAEAVVKALGITPAPRDLYKDERSIYLVQEVSDGKRSFESAVVELEKNQAAYDMPLIAVWGYYKILASAEDQNEMKKGVKMVELSMPYFFDENLQMVLAQAYQSLGEKEKATEILEDLIAKNLLKDKASSLLQELGKN